MVVAKYVSSQMAFCGFYVVCMWESFQCLNQQYFKDLFMKIILLDPTTSFYFCHGNIPTLLVLTH